jgi:hypothetical protein
MNQEINRLLMEIEHMMRAVNREVINPQIPQLTVDDIRPVVCLVAHARASYLKTLVDLGSLVGEDAKPDQQQFDELALRRREYDELVHAAQALEAAIQRGYLDIAHQPG